MHKKCRCDSVNFKNDSPIGSTSLSYQAPHHQTRPRITSLKSNLIYLFLKIEIVGCKSRAHQTFYRNDYLEVQICICNFTSVAKSKPGICIGSFSSFPAGPKFASVILLKVFKIKICLWWFWRRWPCFFESPSYHPNPGRSQTQIAGHPIHSVSKQQKLAPRASSSSLSLS